MANVKDTRSKFHDKIGRGFDIPSEHVESEGERLIKHLAQKQINTKLKLTEELTRKNNFQNPTKFFPLTEFACGEVKLEQFKEINESVLNLEKLYACGLSEEEINLYTDNLKGAEYMKNKYKNLQQEVLNDRLNNIFKKIDNKASFEESISNNLHRQQYELGLCVKPESKETKLYKFALSCQDKNISDKTEPPEHPINKLKEIEQDLFKHLKAVPVPSIDKRRKRARKILDQNLDSSTFVKTNITECITEKNSLSKWDMQEIPTKKEKKLYTCLPPTDKQNYTIENGQIILAKNQHKTESSENNSNKICKGSEFVGVSHSPISIEHIKRYKLSLEDIKKLPKFTNYEPGKPNKVLFAKNLPSNLSENDLIQIFGNFEKPDQNKIVYKIMTGRMKGQAFITFSDEQQAMEALETVNGYLLNGKPIILQFGHKSV